MFFVDQVDVAAQKEMSSLTTQFQSLSLASFSNIVHSHFPSDRTPHSRVRTPATPLSPVRTPATPSALVRALAKPPSVVRTPTKAPEVRRTREDLHEHREETASDHDRGFPLRFSADCENAQWSPWIYLTGPFVEVHILMMLCNSRYAFCLFSYTCVYERLCVCVCVCVCVTFPACLLEYWQTHRLIAFPSFAKFVADHSATVLTFATIFNLLCFTRAFCLTVTEQAAGSFH